MTNKIKLSELDAEDFSKISYDVGCYLHKCMGAYVNNNFEHEIGEIGKVTYLSAVTYVCNMLCSMENPTELLDIFKEQIMEMMAHYDSKREERMTLMDEEIAKHAKISEDIGKSNPFLEANEPTAKQA